jgi:hypothetical protein
MPKVKFTYALKRFFPNLEDTDFDCENLEGLLNAADRKYPGLMSYILDEQGALRKHVNIFVNGSLIRDRQNLTDILNIDSEVYIMQALSGG